MEIKKEKYRELKRRVNEAYGDGMQGDEFVDLILEELEIKVI